MNQQISFIMTENDERKFIDFIYENNCTVLKYILLDDELPQNMYKCSDEASLHYCIADNGIDADNIYIENEYEGKQAKTVNVMKADFSPEPIILFTRGRFDIGVGRLYLNTAMMNAKDLAFIKNKYGIFKQWIVKNSDHVIKIGGIHRIYLLHEAAEQYIKDKDIFQLL